MTQTATTALDKVRARHALRGAWTKPNAKCPVCGDSVYFYWSRDGGRVYFDELGPPWSKHPCTDHDGRSQHERLPGSGVSRWVQENWLPLDFVQAHQIGCSNLYRVSGSSLTQERSIFFDLGNAYEVEMVRFQDLRTGSANVSVLARDVQHAEWVVLEGVGRLDPTHPAPEPLVEIHRFKDDENLGSEHGACVPAEQSRLDSGSTELITDPETNSGLVLSLDRAAYLTSIMEIDDRMSELLAEVASLNTKKSRLLRELLSSSSNADH